MRSVCQTTVPSNKMPLSYSLLSHHGRSIFLFGTGTQFRSSRYDRRLKHTSLLAQHHHVVAISRTIRPLRCNTDISKLETAQHLTVSSVRPVSKSEVIEKSQHYASEFANLNVESVKMFKYFGNYYTDNPGCPKAVTLMKLHATHSRRILSPSPSFERSCLTRLKKASRTKPDAVGRLFTLWSHRYLHSTSFWAAWSTSSTDAYILMSPTPQLSDKSLNCTVFSTKTCVIITPLSQVIGVLYLLHFSDMTFNPVSVSRFHYWLPPRRINMCPLPIPYWRMFTDSPFEYFMRDK